MTWPTRTTIAPFVNLRFVASCALLFRLTLAALLVWHELGVCDSCNASDSLMDYVPQELGMYDTSYEYLDEAACRSCHGASLKGPHHATVKAKLKLCYDCHEADSSSNFGFLIERNCVSSGCHGGEDPYANGWHHNTDEADAKVCIACHDSELVGETSFVDSSMYPTTLVTPTPRSCENCHRRQDKVGDHPRPNPEEPQYRYPIISISESHHMGYEGGAVDGCYLCHPSDPDLSSPTSIRYCERCHTLDSLHRIAGHVRDGHAWEATGNESEEQSDWEPTGYERFSTNDRCFGCHGDNIRGGSVSGEDESAYYSELNGFMVIQDCRYCHTASAANHHRSARILGGDCIDCHDGFMSPGDCRYCHGASAANRHHSLEIVRGDCISCHPPATYRAETDPLEIKDAYITDKNDIRKIVFSPGEEIMYHIVCKVQGDSDIDYNVVGRVITKGAFSDSLKEVQKCYPGTHEITVDGIIPDDAEPGEARIVYKAKLKEVGMPDILDIDIRSDEISVGQIEIKDVYVTDKNDTKKTVFSPGEEIMYHIIYELQGNPDIDHKVVGRVITKGAFNDSLKEVQKCYPGTHEITVDGIIPDDAEPGEASIVYKAKLKEVGMVDAVNIDWIESKITVEDSSSEPDAGDAHEPDTQATDEPDAKSGVEEPETDQSDAGQGVESNGEETEIDEDMVEGSTSTGSFGLAGGYIRSTSGGTYGAGEQVEGNEQEQKEEELSNQSAKSGNVSTMTEKSPTTSEQPRRVETKRTTSLGSGRREIRRRKRAEMRKTRQITNASSRRVSRPLSLFNDEGIPNVCVRGILHCGAGDSRNIAIVELADGKKYLIREGDTFGNIELVAIFPRYLQMRYKQNIFESKL